MLDRVVEHGPLLKRIDELGRSWRLVGPVARAQPGCTPPVRHFYEPVRSAAELDLGFSYCVYSPKQFLLPARETLFRYERGKRTFVASAAADAPPTALVGVHPCDLHGIALLDHVFLTDFVDEHYAARRARTFLIGLDCPTQCSPATFCRDMQTHEAPRGYDVLLFPLDRATRGNGKTLPGDRYGVLLGSDAGRAWLLGEDAGDTRAPTALDERDFESYRQRKQAAFPPQLRMQLDELRAVLGRSYDSLIWEATGARCYSCGSCNLVCPTCYCFDIQEHNDLPTGSGRRERVWDGCQLKDFALVAGNHNFRPRAAQRLRHRVFRKGLWIHERTGLAGCVGCGRCDRACTARIHIREIFNQLAEEA